MLGTAIDQVDVTAIYRQQRYGKSDEDDCIVGNASPYEGHQTVWGSWRSRAIEASMAADGCCVPTGLVHADTFLQSAGVPMKLYYAPGACSLADHIALHEAGASFEEEKVDLKTKRTEGGIPYTNLNPKGYVPMLALDTGEMLTENAAILDWIADQHPNLRPAGAMGRTRLLESLAYISSEIHKAFRPFFSKGEDAEKSRAAAAIAARMQYLAASMKGDFLFGNAPTAADCYLFVMLLWAQKNALQMTPKLDALRERMMRRPAVKTAMTHEGLT